MKKIWIVLILSLGIKMYSQLDTVTMDMLPEATALSAADKFWILQSGVDKYIEKQNFIHWNSGTGTLYVPDITRRVGIGTTTPHADYILDVNGGTRIANGNHLTVTGRIYIGSGSWLRESYNNLEFYDPTNGISTLSELASGGGGGSIGNFTFSADTFRTSGDTIYIKDPIILGTRAGVESINQIGTYLGINRIFSGGYGGCGSACNGHAFVDGTEVNREGVIGYNSFDQKIDVTGTYSYDHISGFQSRPVVSTTGAISRITAYQALPTHSGGTATRVTGFECRDPLGAGVITNNYGVYIETLSRGGNNAAIHVGDDDNDQTLIEVGVTGTPEFNWDESEDRFTLNKGLDISDILKVKADSINAYDTVYLKYSIPPTPYGWVVQDSVSGALFADSLADAGFGLTDDLTPIDEYLKDLRGGELRWQYADGKYSYGKKS